MGMVDRPARAAAFQPRRHGTGAGDGTEIACESNDVMTMRRALLPLMAACFIVLAVGCPPRDPNPTPDDAGNGNGKSHVDPPPVLPKSLQVRIDEAIKNVRSRDLLTTHAFWT